MEWLHILIARLRGLIRRESVISDIDREMRSHVQMETQANIERGMGPEEARAMALRSFGNPARIRDLAYEVRGGGMVEETWQDVRYGVRLLLRQPGFTAVVVLTLALGIGANTAIFSLVYGVVLKPLPYAESDRLVQIESRSRETAMNVGTSSIPDIQDWKNSAGSFEHLTAYLIGNGMVGDEGDQERLRYVAASPDLFTMLGASPLLGRTFTAEETTGGNDGVTILSHSLWKRRFGGNPGVIGQTLRLESATHTIIGVMPADFNFPDMAPAELWLPMVMQPSLTNRKARMGFALARLKPGVTARQAQTEMNSISAGLAQTYPDTNRGWYALVIPLLDRYVAGYDRMFLPLLGAVIFLILIACANIASLFLARGVARQREMAIRTALGASRGRLVRQMLTEGMLVAMAGGAAGLLMAFWGLNSLMALVPSYVPRLGQVSIDLTVLGFTSAVSVLTGLVCGLAPAFRSKDPRLSEALKDGGRGAQAGAARQRLHSVLIVAEVALALVLLIGAGLMLKSYAGMVYQETGFDSSNVLTTTINIPYRLHFQAPRVTAEVGQILERVQGLPEVESAALVNGYPGSGGFHTTTLQISNDVRQPQSSPPQADVRIISADYFHVLKVPLLVGRFFGSEDTAGTQKVAIINDELARKLWPDGNAIGQHFTVDKPTPSSPATEVEVVGVVKNITLPGARSEPSAEVYIPHEQFFIGYKQLVVRTSGDPLSYIAAVKDQVREVNVAFQVDRVQTLEQSLEYIFQLPRFNTYMLALFAALALMLVAVGVYGVLSYSVGRRTREIGIRMALGARARDVIMMIIGQGLFLALVGVSIGLVGAFWLTRLLQTQLRDVSPTDPMTFAGVTLLLILIALLACYVPARRATRVDPLIALRQE